MSNKIEADHWNADRRESNERNHRNRRRSRQDQPAYFAQEAEMHLGSFCKLVLEGGNPPSRNARNPQIAQSHTLGLTRERSAFGMASSRVRQYSRIPLEEFQGLPWVSDESPGDRGCRRIVSAESLPP